MSYLPKYLPPLLLLGLMLSASLPRQSAWASDPKEPIPRFVKVTDYYYRGGQPSKEGLSLLARQGVRTVLDLRGYDDDRSEGEEAAVLALGMKYISLPLPNLRAPSDKQVEQFLAIVNDKANQPVFAHCWRGADRTGVVTAVLRIHNFGWTADEAYAEMKQHGFRSFWLRGMKNYVYDYAEAQRGPGREGE